MTSLKNPWRCEFWNLRKLWNGNYSTGVGFLKLFQKWLAIWFSTALFTFQTYTDSHDTTVDWRGLWINNLILVWEYYFRSSPTWDGTKSQKISWKNEKKNDQIRYSPNKKMSRIVWFQEGPPRTGWGGLFSFRLGSRWRSNDLSRIGLPPSPLPPSSKEKKYLRSPEPPLFSSTFHGWCKASDSHFAPVTKAQGPRLCARLNRKVTRRKTPLNPVKNPLSHFSMQTRRGETRQKSLRSSYNSARACSLDCIAKLRAGKHH